MAFSFEDILGGPKTSTTTTTVTDKPSTNTGLIIAGVILSIGAILGLAWAFGAFKKKA